MAVPRSIGGGEIDLPTYTQVIEELGKADASTGWCVNQGAIYATYASRMPREMARKIWIDPPRAVVANTPAPTAKAVVVPGGYRVTGRQGFSTGCRTRHLGGRPRPDHRQRPGADGGQGRPRRATCSCRSPRRELLDTWHVRGMRGTGTHHFAVNDVFVPAERTVLSVDGAAAGSRPLYRIPRTLLFASGDASVALGMARTCMNTFMDLAGAKAPRAMPTLLRDQSMIQVMSASAEAWLRTGKAFLNEAVREIWTAACANTITLDHRANLRLATTHGIRLAAQIVDAVYSAAGATAVYEDNVLQRYFQDIHVITQHMQSRLSHYELIGQYWLGLPIDENRL